MVRIRPKYKWQDRKDHFSRINIHREMLRSLLTPFSINQSSIPTGLSGIATLPCEERALGGEAGTTNPAN